MAEEIAFENGRISNFEGLMTLTLDRVILHTVVHHSSTSTYTPSFTEETICKRKYIRMDRRTFETHFIRSTQKSRPIKVNGRVEIKCSSPIVQPSSPQVEMKNANTMQPTDFSLQPWY